MLVRDVYLMRPSPQKPTEEDLSSGARISSRLRPISSPLRPQYVRFWSIWGGGDGAINHTCSISLIWRPDEPFYPFEYFMSIARYMAHFLQQPCDDEVLYLEGHTAGALVLMNS